MTISKRKLKAVGLVSVFIEVMREYMEPDQQGEFFFDHAPDMWSRDDRRLFDMMTEIEHRLKQQIEAILVGEKG